MFRSHPVRIGPTRRAPGTRLRLLVARVRAVLAARGEKGSCLCAFLPAIVDGTKTKMAGATVLTFRVWAVLAAHVQNVWAVLAARGEKGSCLCAFLPAIIDGTRTKMAGATILTFRVWAVLAAHVQNVWAVLAAREEKDSCLCAFHPAIIDGTRTKMGIPKSARRQAQPSLTPLECALAKSKRATLVE